MTQQFATARRVVSGVATALWADGGNWFAYGMMFVFSIPVFVSVSLAVCFWLRRRFGLWSLVLSLIPLAMWATLLVVRFSTHDCGNPESLC
jgi:hypothetical protein